MIPNISEHIRILLFTNECVIVPGLGGFISNSKPAHLDNEGVFPSSKKPFFNGQLKNNDGLLAGYLAQKENMAYSEALAELERFTNSVTEQLKDSKQSVLRGLGILQANEEGNIHFTPSEEVNLDIASYGLPNLAITPLKKAKQSKVKEATPLRVEQKREIRIRASYWWTGVAASILLAMGIWGFFAKDQWWPQHEQMALINPFDSGAKENIETTTPEINTSSEINLDEVPENTSEVEESSPIVEETTEAVPAVEVETPSSYYTSSTDSVYYIVVGAFKSERNALKLERKIKAKGYSSSIYHDDESTWIRVCAEQHTKRFEAEERLDLVRTDASPKAWILAVKN